MISDYVLKKLFNNPNDSFRMIKTAMACLARYVFMAFVSVATSAVLAVTPLDSTAPGQGMSAPSTGGGAASGSTSAATLPVATKASGSPALDIDGTGRCDALTDGILLVRYLFGVTGDALIAGATASTAIRTSASDILSYLNSISPMLDIDGNGRVDALTDGLLLIRYMFGLRGTALIDGAIGSGATRTSYDSIQNWIATLVQSVSVPSDTIGYVTIFPGTEYPIFEGGKWIGGKGAGLDWNDVQTVPGKAYASVLSGNPNRYNDSIAQLNAGFAANQYAQGTVYRAAGYSPSGGHEIELLLRFQITPHNARGYEVMWGHPGYLTIVRWNGGLGDFAVIYDTGNPGIGPAVDGDVLRAEMVGSEIRVYKNGTQVASVSDSTWTTGQPGIGFWPVDDATIGSYGWRSYQAGSL